MARVELRLIVESKGLIVKLVKRMKTGFIKSVNKDFETGVKQTVSIIFTALHKQIRIDRRLLRLHHNSWGSGGLELVGWKGILPSRPNKREARLGQPHVEQAIVMRGYFAFVVLDNSFEGSDEAPVLGLHLRRQSRIASHRLDEHSPQVVL